MHNFGYFMRITMVRGYVGFGIMRYDKVVQKYD